MRSQYILCTLFIFLIFSRAASCDELLRRGLFVSVIQEPEVLSNRKEISKLIEFSKKARIKILFVQIYRANQAWFNSKIADSRPYYKRVGNVLEDPLALLISQAHDAKIEVYAWLNMLTLSNNKDANILKKYGSEILTRNLRKKKQITDYKIDNQYFLEPGDLRVRDELSNITEEIILAYPKLDGILFDYVRYPDEKPAYGYTKENTERFKKVTGSNVINEKNKKWRDWKRAQVTECLEQFVKRTRSLRPDIKISATGCCSYTRAYEEAFQDWPSWIQRGLVDFVTVMSYSDNEKEFKKYVLEAKDKAINFSKVNITIGAYELGKKPDVFKRQLKTCENAKPNAGIIFHYGSLLENSKLANFLTGRKTGVSPRNAK